MSEPLLSVRRLQVRFGDFVALEDVNFDLAAGETLGLVGESGSGKSTLARTLLRLLPAAGGEVRWSGENVLAWSAQRLRQGRRDMQIVFQDPMASLNPRMSVADAIGEPLQIFEPGLLADERRRRVAAMLERVGLSADVGRRLPHQFSGGQCQRIAIARAMILRPRLLLCDEPVSSLDVSIQGQIVNLLADLQQEWGTAMLFISHNLAVVRHLSHRVLVIFQGRVVELAERDTLFASPGHPYTRALLDAVPRTGFGAASPRAAGVPADIAPADGAPADGAPAAALRGPLPPAVARAGQPAGCAYHRRCRHARQSCLAAVPPLAQVAPGHWVACHRWREVVYS
jgi:oligopeptide transport system ATP-binding protein